MKLTKITKKGSLHFELKDGRLGVCYTSGYVRVSVKGDNTRLYQINTKRKVDRPSKVDRSVMHYRYVRDMVASTREQVIRLANFEKNNCYE